LPPGKPEQLVKLLAVSGCRAHAETVIEALWPEVGPDSGRKRLRNVLNRLRTAAGDLVCREGDSLVLRRAEVDAAIFEDEARELLENGRASPRLVLARYGGPVLPDERYEDWAAGPRERLERTLLSVLDASTQMAEDAGDVDEALRYIDRAIGIEPYEEGRYLRGAHLLLQQGRRGSALSLLNRGHRALSELGVVPSARYGQTLAATGVDL
jgi:DNA-binding SARP family transcriptional activator